MMKNTALHRSERPTSPASGSHRQVGGQAPLHVSEEQALVALARAVAETGADEADRACLGGAKAMKRGAYAEAISCLSNAVKARSDHALAFHLLGRCFRLTGRVQPALAAHRKAVELAPFNAGYQAALGGILHFCSRTAEAIEAFHAAYLMSAKDVYLIKAMTLIPSVYDSRAQIDESRALLAQAIAAAGAMNLSIASPVEEGLHLFNLPYHGCDDRPIAEAMAGLIVATCKDASYVAPHLKRGERRGHRKGKRKLRLAVVSRYFKRHTIGNFFIGLVENFPRDEFEVLVFSLGGGSDAMSERFRRGADRFIALSEDLDLARREIGKRKPDILLYTDIGMEGFTYGLAFSRLAPVQCATWGHPVTTGIPTIDYFISARDLDPPGSESCYSEDLIRLSRVGCCYERPGEEIPPLRRADFGLPEEVPLYVCPQSSMKLHPEFDAVLDALLRRDPNGVVAMLLPWSETVAQAVAARLEANLGPRASRIRYLKAMARSDFLALLSLGDVMLDPLHFGGGNTTYEACHVGLPIVTLPGRFMRARLAYALYRQMGLDRLVATDLADYVKKAVTIANDPDERAALKRLILDRGDAVFGDRGSLDELAARLRDMVGQAGSKEGPRSKGARGKRKAPLV